MSVQIIFTHLYFRFSWSNVSFLVSETENADKMESGVNEPLLGSSNSANNIEMVKFENEVQNLENNDSTNEDSNSSSNDDQRQH